MNKEERKEMCDIHFGMVDIVVDEFLSRERNRKYKPYREDIMGVAYLALVRASEKFDDQRGVQFRTYASNYIRAMLVTFFKVKLNKELQASYIEDFIGTDLEPRTEEKFTQDEEYEQLLNELDPEDEIDRIIFRQVIIGERNKGDLVEEFGITKRMVERRRSRIMKGVKEKLSIRRMFA